MARPRLSAKEIEVLALIARGHDAKSAARELSVSSHTIYQRLRRAREKLGASNSREAARHFFNADGFAGSCTERTGATLQDFAAPLTAYDDILDRQVPTRPEQEGPIYLAASYNLDRSLNVPLRSAGERMFQADAIERIRLIGDLSAKLAMIFVSICLAALVLSRMLDF